MSRYESRFTNVDAEELSDFAYLYWVHLDYGDGQEEDSYRVGIVPSTHLGNFQAQNFSISSNRLDVATLTWEPLTDSSTKLIMWILRLDGSPPETVQVEPGADSFSDITGGVAACYSLLGLNNFSLSRTDFICLFP